MRIFLFKLILFIELVSFESIDLDSISSIAFVIVFHRDHMGICGIKIGAQTNVSYYGLRFELEFFEKKKKVLFFVTDLWFDTLKKITYQIHFYLHVMLICFLKRFK